MMPEPLTLVCPSAGPRLRDVIETALCDLPVRNAQDDLRGARILFALDAGSAGMDEPTLRLLRRLRSEPGCLEGSVCGFVVDGETELYTKALAQDLALAANLAGAALPGKPLVEGTGSLYNQHILAARRGMSWEETYRARTRELGERLLAFSPKRVGRPKLLVLHASESGRSSTLWIGPRAEPPPERLLQHCGNFAAQRHDPRLPRLLLQRVPAFCAQRQLLLRRSHLRDRPARDPRVRRHAVPLPETTTMPSAQISRPCSTA